MDHFGIQHKDYSSFSNGSTALRQSIGSNLGTTENQLRAADATIRNLSVISKSSKVTKQVINTLLAPAKSATELLGCVAEAVPQTEPVVELFKALLRLELDRQDNDKQIATLYHSMASMLVVLARLDSIFLSKSELTDLLDEKLDEIVKLLNEFGNFCDVYYKNRPVVRFLRISKYSEMLDDFAQSFTGMKHELETLVSYRTSLTVLHTSAAMDSIASDVSKLTSFMNAQTSREREAQKFVESKGGVETILKDNKLLDEVATKLGDNVAKSIQASRSLEYSLHADLELQLKENQTIFTMKLQCVRDQIEETVNRSTTTILTKLDSGPHEIINDADIKAIWKDMVGIKLDRYLAYLLKSYSICRNGAIRSNPDTLSLRFITISNKFSHDMWLIMMGQTIQILGRSIIYPESYDQVYPSIADAIDEDSSGYVSLHELNHFFDARPPNWTTPQWLAYWAAGWYKDNLRYRDKIMARLGVFHSSVEALHPENKEALKEYVESVEDGIKRIVESLYGDVLDYFEDGSDEVVELDALRDKYTEYVTGRVEQQLAKSKHQLDDKRTLSIVIGTGNRLESKVLCVIHRLLKWHHKMFDIGKDKPLQNGVTVAMINSFQVIFEAFTQRTRSLMESWRQQRMDVELQAQWYANGLFEDWYKQEKDQPDDNDYDEEELTEDEGDETEDDELVEYATRPPTAAGTDVGSVQAEPIVGDEEQEDEDEDEAACDDNQENDEEGNRGEDEEDEEDEREAETKGEDQVEENGSADEDTSRSREAREREVDRRLQRLETGMKELKGLMLRILERLEQ